MNASSHDHSVPALRRFSLLATAASLTLGGVTVLNAASFNFSGDVQARNLLITPSTEWVRVSLNPPALEPAFQTYMWGSIETDSGTGTAQAGFAYLASRDVSRLTFTSGGLNLTSYQEPGSATLGFERYTGSVLPFTIRYDGVVIATGTTDFNYVEVSHIYDLAAVGNGQVTLTAAGADPAFYNEVLALTGGTGRLQVTDVSFAAVDNAGLFTTTGSFTAVPEPKADAALAAAGLMGWAAWRRSRRASAN